MAAPGDLEEVLDRHEQMMFHGEFSGETFETEKKAVFEELRSNMDQPYGYLFRSADLPESIYQPVAMKEGVSVVAEVLPAPEVFSDGLVP